MVKKINLMLLLCFSLTNIQAMDRELHLSTYNVLQVGSGNEEVIPVYLSFRQTPDPIKVYNLENLKLSVHLRESRGHSRTFTQKQLHVNPDRGLESIEN